MKNVQPLALKLLLILLFVVTNSFSQNSKAVEQLHAAFQDFRFEKVTFMADSIIINSTVLEKTDELEIYRLKAISHYSIGQQPYCELAFKSMLQIDSGYVLEPSINAPKIIQLFSRIKNEYKPVNRRSAVTQKPDKTKTKQIQNDSFVAGSRSVVLPGWGHNYLDKDSGKWLMAGSAVLIGLSAYFTAASWHYEQKYLNETIGQKIESSFRKFDDAYKSRNILLGTYLLYWAYIQYDFFGRESSSVNETEIVFNITQNKQQPIQFGMNISF